MSFSHCPEHDWAKPRKVNRNKGEKKRSIFAAHDSEHEDAGDTDEELVMSYDEGISKPSANNDEVTQQISNSSDDDEDFKLEEDEEEEEEKKCLTHKSLPLSSLNTNSNSNPYNGAKSFRDKENIPLLPMLVSHCYQQGEPLDADEKKDGVRRSSSGHSGAILGFIHLTIGSVLILALANRNSC